MKKFIVVPIVAGMLLAVLRAHATKQSLPFTVATDLRGPVPADADTRVEVTITPSVDAEDLKTELRGLGGVAVKPRRDPLVKRHGKVRAGTPVRHVILMTVPRGVAGYLAVDVCYRDSANTGQCGSWSFLAGTEGAKVKTPSAGVPGVDSDGTPILIQRSSK